MSSAVATAAFMSASCRGSFGFQNGAKHADSEWLAIGERPARSYLQHWAAFAETRTVNEYLEHCDNVIAVDQTSLSAFYSFGRGANQPDSAKLSAWTPFLRRALEPELGLFIPLVLKEGVRLPIQHRMLREGLSRAAQLYAGETRAPVFALGHCIEILINLIDIAPPQTWSQLSLLDFGKNILDSKAFHVDREEGVFAVFPVGGRRGTLIQTPKDVGDITLDTATLVVLSGEQVPGLAPVIHKPGDLLQTRKTIRYIYSPALRHDE